jgi:hypothetical protein
MLSFGISYQDLIKISLLCKYHSKRGIGELKGGPKDRVKTG